MIRSKIFEFLNQFQILHGFMSFTSGDTIARLALKGY
jgi:hypothetical protein